MSQYAPNYCGALKLIARVFCKLVSCLFLRTGCLVYCADQCTCLSRLATCFSVRVNNKNDSYENEINCNYSTESYLHEWN